MRQEALHLSTAPERNQSQLLTRTMTFFFRALGKWVPFAGRTLTQRECRIAHWRTGFPIREYGSCQLAVSTSHIQTMAKHTELLGSQIELVR
jgi:hypothetical protein